MKDLQRPQKTQPQAAFAALLRSIQHEWGFLQRVVSVSPNGFNDLRLAIREIFWPSLFGGSVSDVESRFVFATHKIRRYGN